VFGHFGFRNEEVKSAHPTSAGTAFETLAEDDASATAKGARTSGTAAWRVEAAEPTPENTSIPKARTAKPAAARPTVNCRGKRGTGMNKLFDSKSLLAISKTAGHISPRRQLEWLPVDASLSRDGAGKGSFAGRADWLLPPALSPASAQNFLPGRPAHQRAIRPQFLISDSP